MGRAGSAPKAVAWCRSTPLASSARLRAATSGSHSRRPVPSPTSQLDVRPEGQGRRGTNDVFAFLTTDPSAEVGAIHTKAMPVILTTRDEVETWMTAPPDKALKQQRRYRMARSRTSPAG